MKKFLRLALNIGVLLVTIITLADASEILNIGYSGPLSGGAANYGINCKRGVELAISEINAAGGITVNGKNYMLKFTAMDDAYKPASTVSNVRRLLNTLDPKPVFIIVPHSGGLIALESFNESEGFLMYGSAVNVEVLKSRNKLVMTYMSLASILSGVTDVALDRGYRNAAVLSGTHEAGKDAENIFKRLWEDKGGKITSVDGINFGSVTDFYPFLTKALANKPDSIFTYGPAEPCALLVKQARELGFKGAFIFGPQCNMDDMLKVISVEQMHNAVGPCPLLMQPFPKLPDFIEKYRTEFKEMPNQEPMNYHDVMLIVAKAMEKSGSVGDAYIIRNTVKKVVPIDNSITDITGFTTQGQVIVSFYNIEILDGKFQNPIATDFIGWCRKYGPTWPATWPTDSWKE